MRLIDADEYKGKCICSHLYGGITKLIEVDNIPTVFDITQAINQIRNIPHGQILNVELEDEIIGIIKSAINIIDKKNED